MTAPPTVFRPPAGPAGPAGGPGSLQAARAGIADGDQAWVFTLMVALAPAIGRCLQDHGLPADRHEPLLVEVVLRVAERIGARSGDGDPACWIGGIVDEVVAGHGVPVDDATDPLDAQRRRNTAHDPVPAREATPDQDAPRASPTRSAGR